MDSFFWRLSACNLYHVNHVKILKQYDFIPTENPQIFSGKTYFSTEPRTKKPMVSPGDPTKNRQLTIPTGDLPRKVARMRAEDLQKQLEQVTDALNREGG